MANTHSQKKIRRIQKRRRRIRIIKLTLLGIIFIIFVYVMNQEYFFVKDIVISGNEVLRNDDIEEIVENYMSQKKFFLFPRKNHFFLGTDNLHNYLSEELPRIYDLDIDLVSGGDVLQIKIEERKAHSLWCNNKDFELEFDQECFYADQDGYIYDESPYFSSNVFPKIFLPVGDILKKRVVYDNSFDDFFIFLNNLSEHQDIKIHHVEKDMNDDIYIYFWRIKGYVFKDNFPYIVYTEKDDYDTVLKNLELTLSHDSFKIPFKNKPQLLESIDVRFKNRIFFAFSD